MAVRPADLHRVHPGGGAKTEVLAKVVLGQVAAACANFAELPNAAGQHSYPRADSGSVASRADKFKEHAMVGIPSVIDQQRGRLANVENDHVHVAVVVHVAKSGAA